MRDFPTSFRTARMIVRDITVDDAGGWKRFNNQIAVQMKSWSVVPSIVYARNEILHYIHERTLRKGYVYVILDTNGKIIGDLHLKNIDRERRRVEIGHAFDPSCWGTGRSHELLAAVCAIARRKRFTVWGKVEEENIRSWKSLEDFGATPKGRRVFRLFNTRVALRVYELPRNPPSAFARKVYAALLLVPAGKITTYKDLAHAVGVRNYRAVGQALRCNPFAPRVPCHRVVAADGSVGGFMGERHGPAISRKIALLEKEKIFVERNKVLDFERKRHVF